MAELALLSWTMIARFSHTGQVCSKVWDYYLFEGKHRPIGDVGYDHYYIEDEGKMLNFFVMFTFYTWSFFIGCGCCVVACASIISLVKEENIYDEIR